jgi:hypothetical protein
MLREIEAGLIQHAQLTAPLLPGNGSIYPCHGETGEPGKGDYMRKLIRALMILAVGGLGVLAAGTTFASAASSQIAYHGQPGSGDSYLQPQGRVNLPDDGSQNPPQTVARPNSGDQPPQTVAAT